jgi:hypothetical protein
MQQQTKASPMPTRWPSSRRRHLIVALALTALLPVTGVLYGAYGYLPAEAGRSYRSPTCGQRRRGSSTPRSPASTISMPALGHRSSWSPRVRHR